MFKKKRLVSTIICLFSCSFLRANSITISFSFCLYMVITSCINYAKFETITTIREINELESLFPAILICNRNTFTNAYSYDYLRNYSIMINQSDLFDNPTLEQIQNYVKYMKNKLGNNNSVNDLKEFVNKNKYFVKLLLFFLLFFVK